VWECLRGKNSQKKRQEGRVGHPQSWFQKVCGSQTPEIMFSQWGTVGRRKCNRGINEKGRNKKNDLTSPKKGLGGNWALSNTGDKGGKGAGQAEKGGGKLGHRILITEGEGEKGFAPIQMVGGGGLRGVNASRGRYPWDSELSAGGLVTKGRIAPTGKGRKPKPCRPGKK